MRCRCAAEDYIICRAHPTMRCAGCQLKLPQIPDRARHAAMALELDRQGLFDAAPADNRVKTAFPAVQGGSK